MNHKIKSAVSHNNVSLTAQNSKYVLASDKKHVLLKDYRINGEGEFSCMPFQISKLMLHFDDVDDDLSDHNGKNFGFFQILTMIL